jgi:hypothetical protein
MRLSRIIEENPDVGSSPALIRLRLFCSVCGESQWTVLGAVDADELKRVDEFYFVCGKHNTTVPE